MNIETWNKPYTILQLSEAISKLINWKNDPDCSYVPRTIHSYWYNLEFTIKSDKIKILDEIDKVILKVDDIISNAITGALHSLENDIITAFFKFPDEIKTTCKQYLIYFAQFLEDIGIEADTEIKEEANDTLFKIIPKDKGDALDKIRDALTIYLNIPGMEDFEVAVVNNTDIALMQLQSNVYHLKSQLALAKTMVQMKDSTIENLQ